MPELRFKENKTKGAIKQSSKFDNIFCNQSIQEVFAFKASFAVIHPILFFDFIYCICILFLCLEDNSLLESSSWN